MKSAINVLIVDQAVIPALGAAILEDAWFSEFGWPGRTQGVRRVRKANRVYLLSSKADERSRFLIANVGPGGVFDGASNPQHVLDRLLHVALATFDRTVSIPVSWRPYNEGSLLSLYAQPAATGAGQRIYFERNPRGDPTNIFAYAMTDGARSFDEVRLLIDVYDRGVGALIEALLDTGTLDDEQTGITLAAPLGADFAGSATLGEWYARKLTAAQRNFVDRPYDRPVRLRGAPGTGKTLSMAIKCLRDIYAFEDAGAPVRFGFITHSAAVAHETLPGMFSGLDPSWRWRELGKSQLWVGSLYELAQEYLRYDQKGIRPISTDGRDGRELQQLVIQDVVSEFLKSSKVFYEDTDGCSDQMINLIHRIPNDIRTTNEVLNEFACVIDAENITLGTKEAESYINSSREQWQIDLPKAEDRRALLLLNDRYRKNIQKNGMLSMDQMIADFNSHLSLHEWRQFKEKLGFDALFVDELHFFNRAERMLFHNLFNSRATAGGKMPLFMSYDLKQSVSDAFIGTATERPVNFFQRLRAGGTDVVELKEVFRYTPEINAFLADLDAAFPALDLGEEWGPSDAHSSIANGETPNLLSYNRTTQMLDDVFERVAEDVREFGGRSVAVLCLNEEVFRQYMNVGRIAGRFIAVRARDEVAELKYAGRRCILSMPEYVAGLQFESVYILNVDRAELTDASSIGERRRFLSRCYLAASRAAKQLSLTTCEERGGASEVLTVPLERGSLVAQ